MFLEMKKVICLKCSRFPLKWFDSQYITQTEFLYSGMKGRPVELFLDVNRVYIDIFLLVCRMIIIFYQRKEQG